MDKFEKKPQRSGAPWWQPAVLMFTKMSAWIVAPVILAVFLGGYLDDRYGAEPWGTLGAVGVAFLISVYGIIKNAKQEYGRMKKEEKDPQRDGSDKDKVN